MLIIRGVNVFPSQIEEQILKLDRLSPHYQLEIHREGSLDQMNVLVELQPDYANLPAKEREDVANKLSGQIKAYVGVSAKVRVLDLGAIERSQGKAVRVVDKRPKD